MVVNYPLSVQVLKSKMDPEKFRVIEDEQARD